MKNCWKKLVQTLVGRENFGADIFGLLAFRKTGADILSWASFGADIFFLMTGWKLSCRHFESNELSCRHFWAADLLENFVQTLLAC